MCSGKRRKTAAHVLHEMRPHLIHQMSEVAMSKRYWLIEGYDSCRKLFEKKVGIGQFTDGQLRQLLMALVAKRLDDCEIVGAYAKRRTKIANNILDVHHDHPTYMCGCNPCFTARIVDEDGKIVSKPELT
jgi:hypothetical protein